MKYATQQRCRMAGVAAFALSIVVIAGCGGGDSSGGSTTPTPVVGTINSVVIQSLSPSAVPVAAGQIVTVTGSGFDARDGSGQRKFTGVKLGHIPANATVISDTTLTFVTPPSLAVGSVDVRIVNTDGISAITASDILTLKGGGSTGTTTGTTTGVTTGTTTGVTTGTTTGTTTSGPPPPPTTTTGG